MTYRSISTRFTLGSLALAVSLGAQAVTDEDILNDHATVDDVVTYGMGLQGQRYSGLEILNSENVQSLQPVWAFSFGGEKMRGQESQPIVKDGVMYVTASYSRAYAIDARTGEEIWQYDARLPDGIMPCCDVVNRGGALYDDLFIFGTLDAKLVALNKDTGKVVWVKQVADYQEGYSITAAPIVINGKLITGVSGGEFGIVGKVEAYDPRTGDLLWTRPTVEGHMGYVYRDGEAVENGISGGEAGLTWPGDMWETGGAATWLGGTYDPDTDTLFFGTGNPAPWNSHLRPGDNLFSSSRLAIDPNDGSIKWHFQTTPNDGWDYDGVNELVSFDYEQNGELVRAAATADRNGFFYVLDRTDGSFIRGFPFVDEISWAEGLDDQGRPIYTEGGRPGDPAATEDDKGEPVLARPAFLGGKNWMPMAYNQGTGLFYVPSNEWAMDIWNEPVSYKRGAAYLGAGFTIKPANEEFIGVLRAIDPSTGEEVWRHENRAPLWGGVMTTAGNLVFTGTPEGYLKAFDARTGEELYRFNTGSGVVGTPITWEMDGEQYVSVASGWGGAVPLWGGEVAKVVKNFNQGGMLWTFKLPNGEAAL
ncbi:PQQ-dependent methanol/ethanol family dehydrogenase [Halomonas sp. MCCC 1A17488]|uniref:PQQ-dependent methanol/ethanol family dehydrogenase n=1 Tax=Billgrantia sulfidoxydans TaxID=2733484 RepID=A0ABX7W6X1_9GAMM|nr:MULTISPECIES: PQQ-dependent methanol/ethanol family dehydrogenase [Halomonas]MCE8017998.1 PQQ-dependent methanol/ethanol family dehydrogenase [Halomonas sp. MCCC 1A17488]MCG3241331.1 PQQ-dependent methanol/ethanol family dehydrogenase [Halomonas sp. MCCC 1A17488]QPP48705.1 PQQ-dependent methanol/ethanol family dehydrogenase [Halomonas sp. SS10-MC5]QTP56043.1 PQQ-dependent methanol/ethanol family dehydrogenase [Halomonas sulfidoxydans]